MVDSVYGPTRDVLRPVAQALSASPRAITIRWRRAAKSRRCVGQDPRHLHGEPGLADLRGAGRARHLRGGEGARHHHPARQYLGDAALFPGAGAWRRPVDRRLHQIYRRPCRRDAGLGHRDRTGAGKSWLENRPAATAKMSAPTMPFWPRGACARWACGCGGTRTARSRSRVGCRTSRRSRNVLHPAFKDCPGHEYWKRDFTGSIGPVLDRSPGRRRRGAANRFVESLELFGIGYSWGGFESLAIPAHPEKLRTVSR